MRVVMKNQLVLFLLMLTTPAIAQQHTETVTKVIDGDTFAIAADWSPYDLHWTVRILGIDTPEKGRLAKCERERILSLKATEMVRTLLSKDNRVRLSHVRHDKYGGRINAEVHLMDGRSIADVLLEAKLAKRYNGNGPKPSWCF